MTVTVRVRVRVRGPLREATGAQDGPAWEMAERDNVVGLTLKRQVYGGF